MRRKYCNDNFIIALRSRRVNVDPILVRLKFAVPLAIQSFVVQLYLTRYATVTILINVWFFGCNI